MRSREMATTQEQCLLVSLDPQCEGSLTGYIYIYYEILTSTTILFQRHDRYHKQFFHGISSVSGKMFSNPVQTRHMEQDDIEGLCHQCHEWIPISNHKRQNSMLWYRHAHKCHVYHKPKTQGQSSNRSSFSAGQPLPVLIDGSPQHMVPGGSG